MNKYKENLEALDNARLTINKLCGKWLPREILDNLEEYGDYELYNYIKYSVFKELVDKETLYSLSYEGDGYDPIDGELVYDTAICKCGRHFEIEYEEHYKYCPNCGQKLSWLESEENG